MSKVFGGSRRQGSPHSSFDDGEPPEHEQPVQHVPGPAAAWQPPAAA